jgi:D-aminoacyl-tRNA deacylase
MIALVQRVSQASVTIDSQVTASIGPGLLILLGVHRDDTRKETAWVARKCVNLRIFADDEGRMNRSIVETEGEILVVSQFTLYGNTNKGNRPSFVSSASGDAAHLLYESFVSEVSELLGREVATGQFGAMMDVALVNDGPVTLWVERKPG